MNVQYIKGVGEARAKTLNRLGISNLEDLITYYPRTYEDRSKIKKLEDVIDGEDVLIKATVLSEDSMKDIARGHVNAMTKVVGKYFCLHMS